ncbi:Adenine phosphoribosyltransferase [Maioricimonas rarisocia]|uniref:Adenine phosphoribosyltransferase n=1 Tax=Maioricimonas rarisocia TaxID=2528026 RepID=A0A517Z938_9PLAN|nr:adenine phosphoribosyltransferase [Maioricimonas rarisocia]QDU38959.1 Adenine phosphoribosyltransferase [Maioricimonas rarisocia]
MTDSIDFRRYIRSIPDFPKPGIMFRDITPLLAAPEAFRAAVKAMADPFRDQNITAIAAAEARGFIFAAPLALELNAAFIPVRKPGKLPFDTKAFHYELEYGTDTLEIHTDAFEQGDRVLLVDDLLATGGTMEACVRLAEQAHASVVGCVFAIELTFLKGREKLGDHQIFSLIDYHDEN